MATWLPASREPGHHLHRPVERPERDHPAYPATVNFTAGVGTASIKLVDAQSTTLTATQGSITGTSGAFAVSPAAVSHFLVTTPATATAGTAVSGITLTAPDPYNNTTPPTPVATPLRGAAR